MRLPEPGNAPAGALKACGHPAMAPDQESGPGSGVALSVDVLSACRAKPERAVREASAERMGAPCEGCAPRKRRKG
jgi:hypothetical protein